MLLSSVRQSQWIQNFGLLTSPTTSFSALFLFLLFFLLCLFFIRNYNFLFYTVFRIIRTHTYIDTCAHNYQCTLRTEWPITFYMLFPSLRLHSRNMHPLVLRFVTSFVRLSIGAEFIKLTNSLSITRTRMYMYDILCMYIKMPVWLQQLSSMSPVPPTDCHCSGYW